MPHFTIECSENVLFVKTPEEIMAAVYEAAEATKLFRDNDIKVRLIPYKFYMLGKGKADFIHIVGNIIEGRTEVERSDLSKTIVTRVNELFPQASFISIYINEFALATYSNKSLIHPLNKSNDRFFLS